MTAIISEHGNGFPDVDDVVPSSDGELYKIVATNGRIHTADPGSGAPNYIYAEVELADWDDYEESEIFEAHCELSE